jgi:hypothetical protein
VLDENLSGHRILAGLRERGIPVKGQTELMRRGISDDEVLRNIAGNPGYFLLSKDRDFRYKPAARRALIEHRLGAFIITSQKGKTAAELVSLIASAWPHIQRCVETQDRPFVAKVLADGRVAVVR